MHVSFMIIHHLRRGKLRGSRRSSGESRGGGVASRPRRARPRSDPASSTRAFRCRVGCPRRTVTGHHATLHAARLSDQDGRRGARGFHLLVALQQEIAHPLAPLGRLAEVKPDLLHGLEAGESSLGHGDAPKQTRTEEPRSVLWAIRRRESPLVHTRVSPEFRAEPV